MKERQAYRPPPGEIIRIHTPAIFLYGLAVCIYLLTSGPANMRHETADTTSTTAQSTVRERDEYRHAAQPAWTSPNGRPYRIVGAEPDGTLALVDTASASPSDTILYKMPDIDTVVALAQRNYESNYTNPNK